MSNIICNVERSNSFLGKERSRAKILQIFFSDFKLEHLGEFSGTPKLCFSPTKSIFGNLASCIIVFKQAPQKKMIHGLTRK